MDQKVGASAERIVKVPFPIGLIRRMDETIVVGRGGFRTRAELMREAVENLLNELEFPDAAIEPTAPTADAAVSGELSEDRPATKPREARPIASEKDDPAGDDLAQLLKGIPVWEQEELRLADLAATALETPARRPFVLPFGKAQVEDEPLLGLHNRDFVSVWALQRLVRYTADGPIVFEDYLRRATKAAWYVGAQLEVLERRKPGKKLTVLFPTNDAKRPSAERGFQSFAIGSLARHPSSGHVPASGPLFAWRAIQIDAHSAESVALTDPGWQLLRELDGLSLELPHAPALMERFMAYLAENAPADRWGFDHLVRVVAKAPDREELVGSFHASRPAWTPSTASSIAQGYVARSREWGLVEPRLLDGRYRLTPTGQQQLRSLADNV